MKFRGKESWTEASRIRLQSPRREIMRATDIYSRRIITGNIRKDTV